MPRGRNSKKTQSLNAVKARTLHIILYQLTNRYRVHSSLDNESNAGEKGLLSCHGFFCAPQEGKNRERKNATKRQADR